MAVPVNPTAMAIGIIMAGGVFQVRNYDRLPVARMMTISKICAAGSIGAAVRLAMHSCTVFAAETRPGTIANPAAKAARLETIGTSPTAAPGTVTAVSVTAFAAQAPTSMVPV